VFLAKNKLKELHSVALNKDKTDKIIRAESCHWERTCKSSNL